MQVVPDAAAVGGGGILGGGGGGAPPLDRNSAETPEVTRLIVDDRAPFSSSSLG